MRWRRPGVGRHHEVHQCKGALPPNHGADAVPLTLRCLVVQEFFPDAKVEGVSHGRMQATPHLGPAQSPLCARVPIASARAHRTLWTAQIKVEYIDAKTGKGFMVAQVPQRDMFRKYGWPAAGQIKELLEELKEGM